MVALPAIDIPIVREERARGRQISQEQLRLLLPVHEIDAQTFAILRRPVDPQEVSVIAGLTTMYSPAIPKS